MSVINQMLKDLQQRGPASGDADVHATAGPDAARSWGMLGWVLAGVLAAALAYLAWERAVPAATSDLQTVEQGAAEPFAAVHVARTAEAEQSADAPSRASAVEEPTAAARIATKPAMSDTALADGNAGDEASARAPVAAAPVGGSLPAVSPRASPSASPPTSLSAPARHPVTPESAPVSAVAEAPPAVERSGMERRARPPSAAEVAEEAYRRGLEHVEHGRDAAARDELRAALAGAPAHRDAAELLAALLMRAGALEEAQRVLEGALRYHPSDPLIAQLLARLHLQTDRVDAAVAVLERRVPEVDAEPEYHALLAALYQRLGRHGEAARSYRALLQYQADQAGWWVGLGISLEGLGHRGEALQAYRRARALSTLGRELTHYADNRIAALEPMR